MIRNQILSQYWLLSDMLYAHYQIDVYIPQHSFCLYEKIHGERAAIFWQCFSETTLLSQIEVYRHNIPNQSVWTEVVLVEISDLRKKSPLLPPTLEGMLIIKTQSEQTSILMHTYIFIYIHMHLLSDSYSFSPLKCSAHS